MNQESACMMSELFDLTQSARLSMKIFMQNLVYFRRANITFQ